MFDLDSIDFSMLLTSKYNSHFMHAEFNIKSYTDTVENMVNKIKYVASLRNKTNQNEQQCGAIFYTLFTTPLWVYIGCDDTFIENHHVCELKDRTIMKTYYTYNRPTFWCKRGSVIIKSICLHVIRSKDTKKSDIYRIRSEQLNIELRLYLTVWSLGLESRNSVVINDHQGNKTCLATDAFTYQRIKLWVIRKPCFTMYSLVVKPYIISEQECKGNVYYTCNDRTCILTIYICDGQFDCPDKSDEKNCESSCIESSNQKNQSKNLIKSHQHCFVKCTLEHCFCNSLYFQCATGACVPLDKICDGKQDCIDGLDETMCVRDAVKNSEFNAQLYLRSYNVSKGTAFLLSNEIGIFLFIASKIIN